MPYVSDALTILVVSLSKLPIILLALSLAIVVATQLIDYRVLDGEFVIPPGGTKSFDVVLYKGAWIRVEAYSNSTIYSTRRIITIYVMDDLTYYGFTGTNSTLKDAIRAANEAAWQVRTDDSLNAVYLDKVTHDSRYHVVIDNNAPAFFSENPKVVELHITVRAPYPVPSYLAGIPIVVAVAMYLLDWRKAGRVSSVESDS